jgi:hypothetical protein
MQVPCAQVAAAVCWSFAQVKVLQAAHETTWRQACYMGLAKAALQQATSLFSPCVDQSYAHKAGNTQNAIHVCAMLTENAQERALTGSNLCSSLFQQGRSPQAHSPQNAYLLC